MNRERIERRIAELKARGTIDSAAQDRLDRALAQRKWGEVEILLNRLEVESRFRSWRPIIRLAMFSSLISAGILVAVALWAAAHHSEWLVGAERPQAEEQAHE